MSPGKGQDAMAEGHRFDRVWLGGRLLTMAPEGSSAAAHGEAAILAGCGVVERGAVASRDGRIAFAGPEDGLPAGWEAGEVLRLEGRWVTPGLVDCHTHLVHGGDRAAEFEARLAGATYAEIARAGGGILSTVRATRAADEDALVASALPRLDRLIAEGVTTVEVKSGYGLDTETELRMLRAARRLGEARDIGVATSFLGAHAVPPGMTAEDYTALVCDAMLPAVAAAGLADAVDVFHESIAFSAAQTGQVFAAARAHGLPVKLHADQLENGGGAALAARWGALSADHLECADEAGAAALARAGTVAVLLPRAAYTLRETSRPPVEALRRHGAHIAVATDCNPGSSPLTSILLAMNMAAVLFRLTVPECLAGVTREAARALGLLDRIGTLETGKRCDLAIWDIERPAELVYRLGFNPLHSRVRGGR